MFDEADYPAAHSMDTTWWAVDRYGQVARFESGEDGPVPDGVEPQMHRVKDLEEPLPESSSLRWFRGDSTEPQLGPPSLEGEPEVESIEGEPEGACFLYSSCGDRPYERWPAPQRLWRLAPADAPHQPLTFAQHRELAQRGWMVFPNLDFQRELLFQPHEHLECASWDERGWVSTTGAPDWAELAEDGEDLQEIALESAPGDPTPVKLAIAYLQDEPGAADVFGDWLAERGSPAPWPAETLAERLDELIWIWFDPEGRAELERSMVEHLLDGLEGEWSGLAAALRDLLERGRDPERAAEVADEALELWQQQEEEVEEEWRVVGQAAWAVWALLQETPLVPSRTARAVRPAELSWQIEQVLEQMGRRPLG